MIVPVKRWATTAIFGLERSVETPQPQEVTVQKGRERRIGLIESFEKLLTVQTDVLIRDLSE